MISSSGEFASVDLDRGQRLSEACKPLFGLLDNGQATFIAAVGPNGNVEAWGPGEGTGCVMLFGDNAGDGPYAFEISDLRNLRLLTSALLLVEDETPRPEIIKWLGNIVLGGDHVAIVITTHEAAERWRLLLAPSQIIGG